MIGTCIWTYQSIGILIQMSHTLTHTQQDAKHDNKKKSAFHLNLMSEIYDFTWHPTPFPEPSPRQGFVPCCWEPLVCFRSWRWYWNVYKEIGFPGLSWVTVTQDMDQRRDLVNTAKKLQLLLSSSRGIRLSLLVLRPQMILKTGKHGTFESGKPC
jgi:hypothetical protein